MCSGVIKMSKSIVFIINVLVRIEIFPYNIFAHRRKAHYAISYGDDFTTFVCGAKYSPDKSL